MLKLWAAGISVACVLALGRPGEVGAACVGDCDDSGMVTVGELVAGVNIAIGAASLDTCEALDANVDLEVSIDELIRAVGIPPRRLPGDGDHRRHRRSAPRTTGSSPIRARPASRIRSSFRAMGTRPARAATSTDRSASRADRRIRCGSSPARTPTRGRCTRPRAGACSSWAARSRTSRGSRSGSTCSPPTKPFRRAATSRRTTAAASSATAGC